MATTQFRGRDAIDLAGRQTSLAGAAVKASELRTAHAFRAQAPRRGEMRLPLVPGSARMTRVSRRQRGAPELGNALGTFSPWVWRVPASPESILAFRHALGNGTALRDWRVRQADNADRR